MRIKVLSIIFLVILILTSNLFPRSKKINPMEMKNSMAPVELDNGVLFSYKDKNAKKVSLAGNFNNWDAGKTFLIKNKYGVWYIVLPLPKGKIEYKFVIDESKWIKDKKNKSSAPDSYGGKNSVFEVKKEYDIGGITILGNGKIRFKYYAPGAKSVFLAGSFNNWSADADPMVKDKNGFWIIEKEFKSGDYQYKYIVDGNWIPDPMNKTTADDGYGGVNSVFSLK